MSSGSKRCFQVRDNQCLSSLQRPLPYHEGRSCACRLLRAEPHPRPRSLTLTDLKSSDLATHSAQAPWRPLYAAPYGSSSGPDWHDGIAGQSSGPVVRPHALGFGLLSRVRIRKVCACSDLRGLRAVFSASLCPARWSGAPEVAVLACHWMSMV